jgi:vacuolar-type H+-ATPase subunit H
VTGITYYVRLTSDVSRTSGGREVDAVADEKTSEQESLEHIRLYQEAMKKESPDSPLHLIRERELEISGHVLAAKKKAEQIVSDARKKASETMSEAETQGERAAREVEKKMIGEAEKEAAKILANVDSEVAKVEEQSVAHRAKAVKVVVDAVTRV